MKFHLLPLLLLTACTSPTSPTITNPQSNLLYLGHQNPITITAPGLNARDLSVRIRGAGGEAIRVSDSSWNVTVQYPGLCTLEVSGAAIGRQVFQARPLPDPVLELSGPRIARSDASEGADAARTGGRLSPAEFQSRRGLTANLENISLSANCNVVSYTLVCLTPGQEPIEIENQGGAFQEQARQLVDQAQAGDVFLFEEVRVQCPGDGVPRVVPGMAVRVDE